MSRRSSFDKMVEPFAFNSKKEWLNAAKQELEGADPIENLKQRIDDIEIFPYYDSDDAPTTDFQLPLSQNEFLGPRTWFNLPRIEVHEVKVANERAMMALNAGADGILFDLHGQVDPNILLTQIELPYCNTAFLAASGQEDFFIELRALAKARKYVAPALSGAIFWKSSSVDLELAREFDDWSQFHALGIIGEPSTSPTIEIATLLAKAIDQLDNFTESKGKINPAIRSIAFSVSVGDDFFLEIAKLKALRILWNKIALAYDPQYSTSVYIHTTINPWVKQAFEPHGNMIHNTTAAMSAVLGGCNSITIEPQDPAISRLSRIARNVSSILREESYLGKVADATAGSFYIERLTDQIFSGAWQKLQSILK